MYIPPSEQQLKTEQKGVKFSEWLLSRHHDWQESALSMLAPSTGRGGFGNDDEEGDDDGGGDEWDWERMDRYRWNLFKWCGETASMREIAGLIGDFVERQNPKKVTYLIQHSKYQGEGRPRYLLQLRYHFDFDISPVEDKLRKILERSDLHRVLGKEKKDNWTLLQEEEVRDYMTYIICFYLTQNHDSSKDNWAKAAEGSPLDRHFSFNVWNRLKKTWASKVLPEISEIAIGAASKGRIERPKSWLDIGKPEVKSDISEMRPPWGASTYNSETKELGASVTAMIPFDWNYAR